MIHETFDADVATVLSALDSDEPMMTPEVREAAKRVFAAALFALVTVPKSLDRIAKAQERLSGLDGHSQHRT